MQIAHHKVVVLDYVLTDDEGNIIDQSQGGQFAYLHGASNIIPGLESALSDKTAGEAVQVRVTPAEGYGERNDAMTQTVPAELFEGVDNIEVGQQFHAQSPDGQMLTVTVTEIEGDNITVDGNHPLAGMHLNFDVQIIEVRDATAEEVAHGHVHGPGGHHH